MKAGERSSPLREADVLQRNRANRLRLYEWGMKMEKDKNLPERKMIRLKHHDYSSPGAYFVTICTDKRKRLFWSGAFDAKKFSWCSVGANCVRPQNLPLSRVGKIVFSELEKWNATYDTVRLHSYVIMPDHLHIMVLIFAGAEGGRTQFAPTKENDESGKIRFPPTLDRMVKQFKGAVTKKISNPIWQKSFTEHVIRNNEDFETRLNYLYENPVRWYYEGLYTGE